VVLPKGLLMNTYIKLRTFDSFKTEQPLAIISMHRVGKSTAHWAFIVLGRDWFSLELEDENAGLHRAMTAMGVKKP